MQLYRGFKNWPDSSPAVVTIGNFDGVHLGHQQMFAATRKVADKQQLPATVISFEPLPHEYFTPEAAPPRLHSLRDRVERIKTFGIDRLLLLRFDQALAAMSAEHFIEQILVNKIQARHIIVGDDFRFGRNRKGTYDVLLKHSHSLPYSVEQSNTHLLGSQRVSSTRVRETLSAGNLEAAAALLGQPYRISGRVVHGEKVGRQLGFPTANIALGKHRPPLRGVFAVWATHLQTGKRFPSVANLGERPTVCGKRLLLEVHALDASPDWYGQHLAVDFIQQIRQEKRFNSLDELKAQISQDANAAREMLSKQ